MLNWYHASCAFRALTRAKSTTKKIEEMDDLVGHEGINSTDKKYLARLIAGEKLWTESGWTEPSGAKSSATEKKTAKKRKASPSPTPKKKRAKVPKPTWSALENSGKFPYWGMKPRSALERWIVMERHRSKNGEVMKSPSNKWRSKFEPRNEKGTRKKVKTLKKRDLNPRNLKKKKKMKKKKKKTTIGSEIGRAHV